MGKGTLYSVKDKLFFCFLRSLVLKWVRCILMFLGLHHRSFNFWGRTKLKKISKRRRKSPVIVQSWRDCLLASHYTAFNFVLWSKGRHRSVIAYNHFVSDHCFRARFIRSVSELQFLGFIKSTKKKTDHVQRLTWTGWTPRRPTTCNDSNGLGKNREIRSVQNFLYYL